MHLFRPIRTPAHLRPAGALGRVSVRSLAEERGRECGEGCDESGGRKVENSLFSSPSIVFHDGDPELEEGGSTFHLAK